MMQQTTKYLYFTTGFYTVCGISRALETESLRGFVSFLFLRHFGFKEIIVPAR